MSELGILPQPIPFGKYYLLERINIGGMAEIFKAKAFGVEGFERMLAVKKILSSIAEDESFINMFIDEAKIAGQLNHPNIAQIFDLGKVNDSYFIALEYIAGKDLKTIFERSRRLGEKVSIPRVCHLIMKSCEGLGHAHHKSDAQGRELHIVHRDVSPQNILVSYEGEVKIIDFGIAKAQGKTSQTQVGILKGKFSYMSPEQVRGLHIDHRSDIFSLGIVLYELLTLERLFLGESDFDTLEKIRKVEMSPPSLYNPHIPKELEDIVLKALAKSPEERYQTAFELADALEQFMRNQNYYYTNKDLASHMKESFSADIDFENKKQEYYRSLNLRAPAEAPPLSVAPRATGGYPAAVTTAPMHGGAGLSWGEDELDTQLFGRDRDMLSGVGDADIVYSDDVEEITDSAIIEDPPTMEFNRLAIQQGLESLSFQDEPLRDPYQDRKRVPTAAMPAVEPRRDKHVTVPGAPAPQPQPHSSPARQAPSSSTPTIIAVTVAVVALGVVGIYLLYPWPAEIHFQTTPAEAVSILVDGQPHYQGATPHTSKLPPGPHTIELRLEGHEPILVQRDFQKKTTYDIQKTFKPLEVDTVKLQVKTLPAQAKVTVNGRDYTGDGPKQLDDLRAGDHTIRVSLTGYEPVERSVTLKKGEAPAPLDITLKPLSVELALKSEPSTRFALVDKETNKPVAKGKTPDTIKGLEGHKTYRLELQAEGDFQSWSGDLGPVDEPKLTREIALVKKPSVASDDSKAVALLDTKEPKEPKTKNTGSSRKPTKDDDEPSSRPDRQNTSTTDPVRVSVDKPKDPPPPKKEEPKKEEPKGTATITIASKPVARIYIDGKDTGRFTPLLDFKISAGKHKIELVNNDFNLRKTYYVTLENGESQKIVNKPD